VLCCAFDIGQSSFLSTRTKPYGQLSQHLSHWQSSLRKSVLLRSMLLR
jgi:hypothetical protein